MGQHCASFLAQQMGFQGLQGYETMQIEAPDLLNFAMNYSPPVGQHLIKTPAGPTPISNWLALTIPGD